MATDARFFKNLDNGCGVYNINYPEGESLDIKSMTKEELEQRNNDWLEWIRSVLENGGQIYYSEKYGTPNELEEAIAHPKNDQITIERSTYVSKRQARKKGLVAEGKTIVLGKIENGAVLDDTFKQLTGTDLSDQALFPGDKFPRTVIVVKDGYQATPINIEGKQKILIAPQNQGNIVYDNNETYIGLCEQRKPIVKKGRKIAAVILVPAAVIGIATGIYFGYPYIKRGCEAVKSDIQKFRNNATGKAAQENAMVIADLESRDELAEQLNGVIKANIGIEGDEEILDTYVKDRELFIVAKNDGAIRIYAADVETEANKEGEVTQMTSAEIQSMIDKFKDTEKNKITEDSIFNFASDEHTLAGKVVDVNGFRQGNIGYAIDMRSIDHVENTNGGHDISVTVYAGNINNQSSGLKQITVSEHIDQNTFASITSERGVDNNALLEHLFKNGNVTQEESNLSNFFPVLAQNKTLSEPSGAIVKDLGSADGVLTTQQVKKGWSNAKYIRKQSESSNDAVVATDGNGVKHLLILSEGKQVAEYVNIKDAFSNADEAALKVLYERMDGQAADEFEVYANVEKSSENGVYEFTCDAVAVGYLAGENPTVGEQKRVMDATIKSSVGNPGTYDMFEALLSKVMGGKAKFSGKYNVLPKKEQDDTQSTTGGAGEESDKGNSNEESQGSNSTNGSSAEGTESSEVNTVLLKKSANQASNDDELSL